jgi:transcription antitermination factor NusG
MKLHFVRNEPGPRQADPASEYWAAIQVRPNYERRVADHLSIYGYEYFLPLYRSRRHWSDRVKELEFPLFPGYLFCRYNNDKRLRILSTPGMLRILGCGGRPTPVSDAEIEAILRIVRSGLDYEPAPYVQIGDRVRIRIGALKGLEGLVVGAKQAKSQFVVALTLLQRSVAVEVDAEYLAPAEPNRLELPEPASWPGRGASAA